MSKAAKPGCSEILVQNRGNASILRRVYMKAVEDEFMKGEEEKKKRVP